MKSTRGKTGRPTKLTPEVRAKVLNALRAVRRLGDAAFAAGVDRATVYRAMRADPAFATAIKEARHASKVDALMRIRENEDWKATAWWLSHLFPDEFADRTKQEISGSLSLAAQVAEAEKLNVDELIEIVKSKK